MAITTCSSCCASHYDHARLSHLPVSMCILYCWGFFFPSHHRGIPLSQKLATQVVGPLCYFYRGFAMLLQGNLPTWVTLPQFPHPVLPPQLPAAHREPPLLTPKPWAVRRGNVWVLAMDSRPSGEDKTGRLSCLLPRPLPTG